MLAPDERWKIAKLKIAKILQRCFKDGAFTKKLKRDEISLVSVTMLEEIQVMAGARGWQNEWCRAGV
jgi:hypothetical protein